MARTSVTVAVAACLAVTVAAPALHAAADERGTLERQLGELDAQLGTQQEQLATIERRLAAAREGVEAARRQLAPVQLAAELAAQQAEAADAGLRRAGRDLQRARAELAQQEALLQTQVSIVWKHGTANGTTHVFDLVGGERTPAEVAHRVASIQVVLGGQSELVAQLESARDAVSHQRAVLTQRRRSARAAAARREAAARTAREVFDEAEKLAAQIDADRDRQALLIAQLQSDRSATQERIETLDRPAAPAVPTDSIWDQLAVCESGGRWDYDGRFDGGLQFHPLTWDAYKPAGYPTYAWQATREQQIAVAELVLADQGWQAWPTCSSKLGLR